MVSEPLQSRVLVTLLDTPTCSATLEWMPGSWYVGAILVHQPVVEDVAGAASRFRRWALAVHVVPLVAIIVQWATPWPDDDQEGSK